MRQSLSRGIDQSNIVGILAVMQKPGANVGVREIVPVGSESGNNSAENKIGEHQQSDKCEQPSSHARHRYHSEYHPIRAEASASMRTLSGCVARIGLDLRMSRIGIDEPYFPMAVVIEKGREIPAWNLARPNDFRGVDFRSVIHPFMEHIVVWSIANYNEMLLGRDPQLPGDLGAR